MSTAAIMASAVYFPPTNKIYVFGGQAASTARTTRSPASTTSTSSTWSAGANLRMSGAHRVHLLPGRTDDLARRQVRHGQVSAPVTGLGIRPCYGSFDTSRARSHSAVRGAASGLIGHFLYVAGGRDGLNHVVNLNWRYHSGTNTWLSGAPLPQPTNVPAGGADMGSLYVWGGGNPFLMEPWSTGALYRYDPGLNAWTVLAHERGALVRGRDVRRRHGICGGRLRRL